MRKSLQGKYILRSLFFIPSLNTIFRPRACKILAHRYVKTLSDGGVIIYSGVEGSFKSASVEWWLAMLSIIATLINDFRYLTKSKRGKGENGESK